MQFFGALMRQNEKKGKSFAIVLSESYYSEQEDLCIFF